MNIFYRLIGVKQNDRKTEELSKIRIRCDDQMLYWQDYHYTFEKQTDKRDRKDHRDK